MMRLKILFLSLCILLAVPNWRFLDMFQWLFFDSSLYALMFFLNGFFFISIPLFFFKFRKSALVSSLILLLLSGISSPNKDSISNKQLNPQNNHCSSLSYTATFYPVASWLPPSHADDLAIRNQLCWAKKLIRNVPARFQNLDELNHFLEQTREDLLSPQYKFRVTLPLIGLYHLLIFSKYADFKQNVTESDSKEFIQSLQFWSEQYTHEINSTQYPWWDFPHGPYIKWEYGLVEKNWERIIEFLRSQESV